MASSFRRLKLLAFIQRNSTTRFHNQKDVDINASTALSILAALSASVVHQRCNGKPMSDAHHGSHGSAT